MLKATCHPATIPVESKGNLLHPCAIELKGNSVRSIRGSKIFDRATCLRRFWRAKHSRRVKDRFVGFQGARRFDKQFFERKIRVVSR